MPDIKNPGNTVSIALQMGDNLEIFFICSAHFSQKSAQLDVALASNAVA